jgi:hypothetical protein
MTEIKMPEVGDTVVYHLPDGKPANALVTALYGNGYINAAFVNPDPNAQDQYGRQLARTATAGHGSFVTAHGNYWRFTDEEPNGYTVPTT